MIAFIKSFEPFKSIIKLNDIHTDNNIFKLHYKFSVTLLMLFCILLTSKLIIGEQIDCYSNTNMDKNFANTYCWIHATYVLNTTFSRDRLNGLGNEHESYRTVVWQSYYQWVCVMFCFQSLSFYFPRYLWKCWEGRRLRLLISNLTGPLVTPEWTSESRDQLVKYLLREKHPHNLYTLRYAFCECLNFVNVILQFFLINWFLNGQFMTYGYTLFSETKNTNVVFSKVAKCLVEKFGNSGSNEGYDFLCVLPLNLLNEKLFIILWFWFITLAILTFLALVYRLFVLCSQTVRIYLLSAQLRTIGWNTAALIARKMNYGDFFMLYNIGKNVNGIIYHDLISAIYSEIRNRKSYREFSESFLNCA